jgi:hypothetical protein
LSSGDTDWQQEPDLSARPFGARSAETRPFGARPFGARSTPDDRPFGARPFGARATDDRPFGARPFGARPFGARPFGARPFGARPFDRDDGGASDLQEWSAALAELVCERSAVIRMGATLVAGPELRVYQFVPRTGFRPPAGPGPAPPAAPAAGWPESPLRPGAWAFEAAVEVPQRLATGLTQHVEIADSLLIDLAEALAVGVDGTCLGTAAGGPPGAIPQVGGPAAQLLQRLRGVVQATRNANPVRSPGWILHPSTVDTLTRFRTLNGLTQNNSTGRTLDRTRLLELDGADGGTLLGFPFVTSAAATQGGNARAYFSVDWQEAWLGVEPYLVALRVTGEAAPTRGATVLRASLPLDVAIRLPAAFRWTAG